MSDQQNQNETSNPSKKEIKKSADLLQEAYKPDAEELKKWREAGYPGLRKPSSFA
jgi:hypothetical protein